MRTNDNSGYLALSSALRVSSAATIQYITRELPVETNINNILLALVYALRMTLAGIYDEAYSGLSKPASPSTAVSPRAGSTGRCLVNSWSLKHLPGMITKTMMILSLY